MGGNSLKDTRTNEEKVERLSKLGVKVQIVNEVTEDILKDSKLILGKMNIENNNENRFIKNSLEQSLKEMNLMREGKMGKRNWREMFKKIKEIETNED
jgi:hypothetical protein